MLTLVTYPERMSTYERARARTRTQLVAAGKQVMSDRGVEGTTIAEVAAHANVSPGTFYNYFADVPALLDAVVDDVLAGFDTVLAEMATAAGPRASMPERFARGVDALLRQAEADPVWAWCMVRFEATVAKMRDALYDRVAANIRAGIRSGDYATRVDSHVVADLLVGTLAMSTLSRLEGRTDASHNAAVAELLLRALGLTPKRAERVVAQALI